MSDTSQFRTVDAWKEALGLLPVRLRYDEDNIDRYVLLNGSRGNFCLDFVGDVEPRSQRAVAWSCDVGHYITCAGDSISVNRWDRNSPEERFSGKSVFAQIHEFHRYLEKSTPDQSKSIVAHVLGVFRRIRAATQDERNGLQSLSILLHMLASAASGGDRLSDAGDLAVWGLSPEVVERSRTINTTTWDTLCNDLSGPGRYDVLRPEFTLVLRHASGALFQDAHLEASNPLALWLPGFELPANIDSTASPNETGVYFTPSALARTLAEEATLEFPVTVGRPLTIFDPACGSGELLKEVLRLLQIRGYRGEVRIVGWDKSPAAVDMARFVLAWEKRAWPPGRVNVEISEHDSVAEANWPAGADVLVMNPPFKSWQLMSSDEQEVVRDILGDSGKPNLAMAFARRALSVLSEGGVLAMITPNSLLEGSSSSARETREALAQSLAPQLVARLGDQTIFARALVDAGIYVGKRKTDIAPRTGVLWADASLNSLGRALRGLRRWRGAESLPITEDGFSVYSRADIAINADAWVARRFEAWSLYKRFHDSGKMQPAKKVFEIHQGIRLGNDVFIVPREYFKGLNKGERRFFRPAVMNPSIVDGVLRDDYYAFYPYTEGIPNIENEESLQQFVPRYYKEYLLPAKAALKARKTLVRQSELRWWDLLWSRPWQKKPCPKIVSKYFGRNRPFVFDKSGEFVVVVGNGWLLKKGGLGESAQNQEGTNVYEMTEEESYLATVTYLCSTLARDLLEYLSVQVSGGQLDLSSKYIGDLPIPNFATIEPAELNEMIRMGEDISDGRFDRWSEVDQLVLSILA
jgi:adenine-specific DNA-methyltransferase